MSVLKQISGKINDTESKVVRIDSGGWSKDITGGADNRNAEIILKQGTTYRRKFLSGSDSNIIQFRATWGEYINKN